jgi:hypothetical protein
VTEGGFARDHRRKLPWGFIFRDAPGTACAFQRRSTVTPIPPTNEAYAEVVSFDGTMMTLHRLTAGAVAQDRDE